MKQITPTGLDPSDDIKRGDIVRSIGGRPTAEVVAEAESLVSAATPQGRRYRALDRIAGGPYNEAVELVIDRPAETLSGKQVTLHRTMTPRDLDEEPRPEKIVELRPGIYYIDISRINDADFNDALPDLEKAKAIVFDWRGYPRNIHDPMTFLGRLMDHWGMSPQWHVPIVQKPDHREMKFDDEGRWKIAPASPYLKARKVFIIDESAISYAESCLGIIEAYKLGDLVGRPTAGTNGNVNRLALPGGCSITFTGMKVLKHDGSRHHGVGILPTLPVSRTVEGVTAGRDELLEKALDVASKPSDAESDSSR